MSLPACSNSMMTSDIPFSVIIWSTSKIGSPRQSRNVSQRDLQNQFRVKAKRIARRRRRRRLGWLSFAVGWGTWFGNRRIGLRNYWFRLRTLRYFRQATQP